MSDLLVRHPAPFATESLRGYVLRLGELNGYQTPWSIFTLAGMKEHERRTTGFRVEKLAAVINRPVVELRAIAYAHPTLPRACRLLGHDLIPTELSLKQPKLCPDCVKALGFIEAHWDLNVMTACPVHGVECMLACPQCGAEPGIYRPGLLECHCGSSLDGLTGIPISDAHRDLLEIVRRTVLRIEPIDSCTAGMPVQELAGLDLRQILVLIRVLGRLTVAIDARPTFNQHADITRRAADLLANWPNNLWDWLAATAKLPTARMSFARGAFESLYNAIFKSRILSRDKIAFMRDAFADFAVDRWDRNFLHKNSASSRRSTQEDRRSRKNFAKHLGIDARTLGRLIELGEVRTETITVGDQSRTLCIASANTIAPVTPGRILWFREAADEIGIPVNILRILKQDGDFPCKHYPRAKSGFHEHDIRDFIRTVAASTQQVTCCNEGMITFKTVMHRLKRDMSWQLHFVRAILNREIALSAQSGNNLATLLIAENEYSRYIKSFISPMYGATVDLEQVAQLLYCDVGTVPFLVRAKYLKGRDSPIGFRVSVISVEQL